MSAHYAIGDAFKGLQKCAFSAPLLSLCAEPSFPRSSSCLMFFLPLPWLCLTPSRTPTRVRVSPSRLVPVALFEFFFFLSRCHSRLALLTSSVALPIYILPHRVATRTLVSLLSLPSCFSKFLLLQQQPQNEISTPFESLLDQCHAYNPTIRVSSSQYLIFFVLCWH